MAIHLLRDTGQLKILIVEDDAWYCTWLRNSLEREGFSVVEALSMNEAEIKLRDEQPDILVLDVVLPTEHRDRSFRGIGGITVLEWLRSSRSIRQPSLVIAMTGTPTEPTTQRLLKLGTRKVFKKPFFAEDFCRYIRSNLKKEVAPNDK